MKLKSPLQNKYIISIGLSLMAFIFVTGLGFVFPQQFHEWEEKSLDYRFRHRSPVPVYPHSSHIGIDDRSLDAIGVWPWDRAIHAKMIQLLERLGAAVMSLDIIFPRRSSEEGDARFIQAVKQAGNVVLSAPFQLIDHPCFTRQEYQGFLARFPHTEKIFSPIITQNEQNNLCIAIEDLPDEQAEQLEEDVFVELVMHSTFIYTGEDDQQRVDDMLRSFLYSFRLRTPGQLWYANRAVAPMEGLSPAGIGLGHISATPDSDGVFRRVPLVIQVRGQLLPSLAFATVLAYLQVAPEDVEIFPGRHIVLHNALYPDETTRTDIRIPIDRRLQLRVNYPSTQSAYSFFDVLAAADDPTLEEVWKPVFEHTICTIGYISTGTGDIGPSPLQTNYSLAFIHPAIINTILTQNFLYDTGWGVNGSITLLLLFFMSIMFARLSPLRFSLVMLVTMVLYIVIALVLFNYYGLILKLVHPVFSSLTLAYTFIILYWYATEERERKHLRSAFKTYVSKQMLAQILDNPQSLTLAGTRKELTIMFSDVRKFSTLSDQIEPEVIHRLLNLYFNRMTKIAFQYDGFVDKFIGDGLLCFFGDPIYHPDHALRAVRAAINMQRAVREIGPEIQETLGLDPIVIRIGINTGYVIVGNMGSAERMEYTVLGSEVNLAQRLEASATPGQIMISQNTYEQIRHEITARDMGDIHVKGFDRPIQVYEIELPFE